MKVKSAEDEVRAAICVQLFVRVLFASLCAQWHAFNVRCCSPASASRSLASAAWTEFSDIFRRAFASRVFPKDIIRKLGISHVKGTSALALAALLVCG